MDRSDRIVVTILGVGSIGRGVASVLGRDGRLNLRLYDPFTAKDIYNSPKDASNGADIVIVCVINEEQVKTALLDRDLGAVAADVKPTVIMCCSTVSPKFAKWMGQALAEKNVLYIDAPVNGGPVGAAEGALMVMASGPEEAFEIASLPLKLMSKKVVRVGLEWGMGSTLKCVNQCLSGTHIAAAAEALLLAHKSGLDLKKVHEAIGSSGGASFMFNDRGPRIIKAIENQDDAEVRSAVPIFIKDLKIVQEQSRLVNVETKLSKTALSLFEHGQDKLSLGKSDDSSVVKVYQDPSLSVVEVYDEPHHKLVLRNEWCNVIVSHIEVNDSTLLHAHRHYSLNIYLNTTETIDEVTASAWGGFCRRNKIEAGMVLFGEHLTEPLLNKMTCKGPNPNFCVECEIIKSPAHGCNDPLDAPFHELINSNGKARVYKLVLRPGEEHQTLYGFHHCVVVLTDSKVGMAAEGGLLDSRNGCEPHVIERARGDAFWRDGPVHVSERNAGLEDLCFYIIEYLVCSDQ